MALVVLYVAAMVLFGCLNTETTKMQFTLTSTGIDGVERPFHKPWQAVFTMFLAMSVVLIYHFALERKRSKTLADAELGQPLAGETAGISGRRTFLYVGAPALFDLLGTGCSMIGFVYLSASIAQMLRGSTIVISAILSVLILRRKLRSYNWLGVFFCMVGISLVGLSNVLRETGSDANSASSGDQLFGMCMNLTGQVFASLQIITEEKLLKKLNVPPMLVVGYEGVWGTILMVFVVFPLLYCLPGSDAGGSMENAYDTSLMLQHNPKLFCLITLYIFSCSTYNIAGMLVTGALSGVHRMMLEASRTMVIWVINLSFYYFVDPSSSFGEKWTAMSFLQLAGFVLVIFGQTVYGAVLKLPGVHYDELVPVPSPSPASMYLSPGVMQPIDDEDEMDGDIIVDGLDTPKLGNGWAAGSRRTS